MLFKPEDLLPGCQYFTHREALWLPTWKRMANGGDGLNDEIMANLIDTFKRLDRLRATVGRPINVHCAFRPPLYNKLVKGAPKSAHLTGQAVDFDIWGLSCNAVRIYLIQHNMLEQLNMRMEDNGPAADWIHLDTKPVPPGGLRFFKP